MKLFKAILILSAFAFTGAAHAATHEVKMLNNAKNPADGIMVFEPSFLKVNKGDTIKFLPTDPSHDVSSVSVPNGAKPFAGAVDKPVTVTVTEEGVYLYECKTHIAMAMVGVIQVGKASNLASVKTAAADLQKKFVMNKDRLDKIMAQVK